MNCLMNLLNYIDELLITGKLQKNETMNTNNTNTPLFSLLINYIDWVENQK